MERSTWLEWRQKGIGSSDAPIIMGVSPWKTPRQLYHDKVNPIVAEEESSYVMDIGNQFEPIARAQFAALYSLENDVDETFSPRLVEMAECPTMRASLDGCSRDGRTIIEVKYQGQEVHESGIVPEKYYPQVQHALMASGAQVCYFVSINDQRQVRSIRVERDDQYMLRLLNAEVEFWACVQSRVPPDLIDGDFKSLRYKGATEDARQWLLSRSFEIESRILKEAKGRNHMKMKGIRIIDNKLEAHND